MAANEIDLKDVMLDCHEANELLKNLNQVKDDLYQQGEQYYQQYNTHPPELLREYVEVLDRCDVLQQQLSQLQSLSEEIATNYQSCSGWLDKARDGTYQCDMNLFKKPHTQRDLGKENNVIASTALSTTLRFVYADDEKEVVDNGYIFYWVYDYKQTDKIEDEPLIQFTRDARPMLPVGVGRTDKNGYLRKSMMFRQNALIHRQDKDKHYLQLKLQWDTINSAQLLNHEEPKDWSAIMEKSQQTLNVFGQLQGNRPFYLAHAKANRGHFEQALSESDRTLQDLYAFHIKKEDFDKAEAVITQKARDSGVLVKDFIKRVSNRYFYLFKAYGFLCYPIDRGSFLTKDLHSLTQTHNKQPAVAWKGYLKPHNQYSQADPILKSTVAIHCTLPEWDRRIQRQIRRLKNAQDIYITNLRPHQKVTGHLDGMLQTALTHRRFSVDVQNNSEAKEQSDTLIQQLQGMQESIENALEDEKSADNKISVKAELDDIKAQAMQLRALLNSEALLAEFKRYWGENGPQETDEQILKAGPYMQEEPYWLHFFHTYCEAIIILRNTPLSNDIFNEEISPLLDDMVEQADFKDLAPGNEVEKLIGSTNEFFAGQMEENQINKGNIDKNIVEASLLMRVQAINEGTDIEEDEGYEYKEKDSLLYTIFKGWQKFSTLFHKVPGPPSVLQVLLDVYADHISKKIQRNALSNGSYHIKLMMVICNYFGVFGKEEFKKNRDLMYTALRAHGRLHRKGGSNHKGGKNHYSNSALKARMQLITGEFGKNLSTQQKADLNAVMRSVEQTKLIIKDNFYQRPFPGFAANITAGGSFSDTVYSANNRFAYKGIMAFMNLGFMIESWINLPHQATKHWDDGEYLRYIATLSDTLGMTTLTAYNTSRLLSHYKLTSLVNNMEQARQSGLLLWQKADTRLKNMSHFMDNLAASLSLLAAVVSVLDGFKYQERGQTDKALAAWLKATAAGMTAYGFYAGKYAEKGAFIYLSGKIRGRMNGMLSRLGTALFLPYIGEAAALAGAILSAVMVVYDIAEMIINYNKSTLLQQFDFHFEQLSKLKKEPYFQLNHGEVKKQYESIADYDGILWTGMRFDNLHINALIPLLSLSTPLAQIRDMLEYNDHRLISELIHFSDRVSDPSLSEHYYIIDDTYEGFAEIAQRLKDGSFFDTRLSHYQQRELILTQYARYREYPKP